MTAFLSGCDMKSTWQVHQWLFSINVLMDWLLLLPSHSSSGNQNFSTLFIDNTCALYLSYFCLFILRLSSVFLIVYFTVAMIGVEVKKDVIVTVSSDKGLCGGINSTSVKVSKALHKLTAGISWKPGSWLLVFWFLPKFLCALVLVSFDCPRSWQRNKICDFGGKGKSSIDTWFKEGHCA